MAMAPRTYFLVQLLQKLGAPLMGAVNSHSAGDASGEKDAATMASLLSESIKISISLSQAMNLKSDDGDADAIRVSLAALASGLVADSYKQTGRVPSENDVRRISKALESVIVFADNFAPASEHAQRLQTLDGTPPFIDPVQANIYSLHALAPAISAIAEFSFGQQDTRLIQDVADRLAAKSKDLLKNYGGANAMSELVILQALGQIYAGAHRAETARLKAKGDDGAATIDIVWTAFEKQVAMLGVLLGAASGGTTASSGGGGGVKPAVEAPAEETPQAPPPVAAPPAAAPPAGAPASPMGFFKKK
jgi:hypothetical protein